MKKLITICFMFVSLCFSISADTSESSCFITYLNKVRFMNKEEEYVSRLYILRDMKYRNEIEKNNSTNINILRIDKNVLWSLNQQGRTYTEEQMNGEILDNWTYKNLKDKSKKIKQEKVLNQDCEVYEFSEKFQIEGFDIDRKVKIWFIKDSNIMLKREESAGSLNVINEATDIKFEELSDMLFEIPDNYNIVKK